jgi:hypothetical protein
LTSSLPDDDSGTLLSEVKHYTEKLRRMTSEIEAMLDDLKGVQSEDLWKIGTGRARTTLRIG